MSSPSLQELRQQLREKFPQAYRGSVVAESSPEPADRIFEISAFPPATISEIIPDGGEGLATWLAGLLADPPEAATLPEFVLVDGGNRFDPASHTAAACSRLLWVRCRQISEALKAADLLVRDANVPFVMLDLCGLPGASLKSIPASAWWRLKQLCENGGCRLVVMSPAPLVPCASLRLAISNNLTLGDFDLPRSEILQRVSARPQRQRRAN